jgi:hypothetical protein
MRYSMKHEGGWNRWRECVSDDSLVSVSFFHSTHPYDIPIRFSVFCTRIIKHLEDGVYINLYEINLIRMTAPRAAV